jgi:hypothetical protein
MQMIQDALSPEQLELRKRHDQFLKRMFDEQPTPERRAAQLNERLVRAAEEAEEQEDRNRHERRKVAGLGRVKT